MECTLTVTIRGADNIERAMYGGDILDSLLEAVKVGASEGSGVGGGERHLHWIYESAAAAELEYPAIKQVLEDAGLEYGFEWVVDITFNEPIGAVRGGE